MWAGKKAAGKKNKFEMEKGLVFNKSFDLVLSLKNFNFCNLAGSIAYNVLRLGDVAEIEAQMFSFAQKLNRRTELEFSTSAAILPNRCWLSGIFLFNIF